VSDLTQEPKKKSLRERLKETVAPWSRPERTEQMYDRLTKSAGMIPLLNVDDTDSRRQEIKHILKEAEDIFFEPLGVEEKEDPELLKKQREVVKASAKALFGLFFHAGNPWYRGLDDRELAEKVSCFLANYTEVGYMDEFVPDLFEEALQLLSLSWKALDVTNTPMYIIESRPVIIPKFSQGPNTEVDTSGFDALTQEVDRLREKVDKKR
jgi:hypothetical protein